MNCMLLLKGSKRDASETSSTGLEVGQYHLYKILIYELFYAMN